MRLTVILFILLPSLILSQELILEKADSLEYKGGLLSAFNSEFTWGDKRFLAKNLLVNPSSQTLKANDVDIFSQGWHLFGREIAQEGERLEIKDGWFTACGDEKPHYRLTSERITLTKDKVKARNLYFRMMGIPILWLPGYSYNLKEVESPYYFELGRCNKKGIFLKSNYLFQSEFGDLSLSLDLYQKKGIGLGGEIKRSDSKADLYYVNESWAADGLFKYFLLRKKYKVLATPEQKYDIVAKAENYKDQDILVDYLDQKPRDETRNLLYLEESSVSNIAVIGLEDRKIWKGKGFEPESTTGFLSFSAIPQPIGGLITDSDVSFSTDGDNEIQGNIGKGFSIGNLSFFQLVGFRTGYKENIAEEAFTQASNIRLNLSENVEWNIEYNTAYSLEKNEMTKRDIGLSAFTDIGKARLKIGTEFDCKASQNEIEIESDLALERGLSLSFDGVYRAKKKGRMNVRLAKERIDACLSVLAKEKEPLLFYPSLLIRPKQGLSISATGYISQEEIQEIKTKTSFCLHCIKTGFNLNWRNKNLTAGLDFGLILP